MGVFMKKPLILWWVVVYDKYKTALVSDPRHRIARVDFLRPESPRRPEKINSCDPVTRIVSIPSDLWK
jgi:hypothetical protein